MIDFTHGYFYNIIYKSFVNTQFIHMSLQRAIAKHLLSGPTSLAELQLATQVSLPTLRRAVQELTDAHWIRIVGQAEANGGRPAMLFGVDDSTFALVGVHLQLPGLRLILSDLTGQVLDEVEHFEDSVPTPDEAIQTIIEYTTQIRMRFPERRLLGVGIASPGFVDLETGDILSIGRVPTWVNFPICRRLQATVNLPVHIANDIDCMAFAELHYTPASRVANLVYAGFDEGVKFSLFLKGELYQSALGNAGLITPHLLAVPGLPDTQATARLLTIAGMNAIFEEQLEMLDPDAQRLYDGIVAQSSLRERVQRILEGATDALPLCQTIVRSQIEALAAAVATVILLIQPDVVVVGGLMSVLPLDHFAALETTIRRYTPMLIANKMIVQQGRLSTQSGAAIGANQHFLQVFLTENGEL